MSRKLQLGVLASHRGTTLQVVLDACADGELQAEIAVVISNNATSGALQRARRAEVAARHISDASAGGEATRNLAIRDCLRQQGAQLVLLAGYMKKLGDEVLAAFPNRILNMHPALLPKFGGHGMYGDRVHAAVLAAGEQETGVTLHLVNSQYDRGPIIAQRKVSVRAGDDTDSLASRVQKCEKTLLIEQLQRLSEDLSLLDQPGRTGEAANPGAV